MNEVTLRQQRLAVVASLLPRVQPNRCVSFERLEPRESARHTTYFHNLRSVSIRVSKGRRSNRLPLLSVRRGLEGYVLLGCRHGWRQFRLGWGGEKWTCNQRQGKESTNAASHECSESARCAVHELGGRKALPCSADAPVYIIQTPPWSSHLAHEPSSLCLMI
jgi:hypothetical protein